jgi:hypothetical protein
VARAPRARARKTAADDDAAGEAAIAEMVQWAGGDLPRWRVKHAFLYNPSEALRLATAARRTASASLALQRVGELTDDRRSTISSDLANSLTTASVGSRRALACDRRRLAIARIEAEDSDELLRSWNHDRRLPSRSPQRRSAPCTVASTVMSSERVVLSLSGDERRR